MSTEVQVAVIPLCDICKTNPAAYDGKTTIGHGPWAYMCEFCWTTVGVGQLGTGFGQRLVLRESKA